MQPWLNGNTRYPPPNSTLLKDHFRSSIAKWMKAASDEYEEGSLEDPDEVPELAGTVDDSCLIASELGDDVALPRDGGKASTVMNIPALVQGC